MIPKNKRRSIVVKGIEYEYCIGGERTDEGRSIDVVIYIKNLSTMKTFSKLYEVMDGSIKPSDVKEMIIENKV